jgi:hypothetical protein
MLSQVPPRSLPQNAKGCTEKNRVERTGEKFNRVVEMKIRPSFGSISNCFGMFRFWLVKVNFETYNSSFGMDILDVGQTTDVEPQDFLSFATKL